ncbi:Ppx/GppA phosphatase family protein [Prauserella flavalba]|uniref:Ppx/GppA phosphatase family protein n=1 Tax=Prauserella flavalba TaxID=1477506 RepID=UPI000D76CC1F|nr:exopolyphosphatase [Prauserella flavalba]
MRTATAVGVLDVGCFSARLLVVERGGSLLDPVCSHKTRLRLDRALDREGRIGPEGVDSIVAAVGKAGEIAARRGVDSVFPLATSSIRDAANATEVVERVRRETGTELRFLSGQREAELSYLAARRWFGASAGPLAVLDIGGGTVELAAGEGEQASFARSLRLGARESTRTWLQTDVPPKERIAALRGFALERARDVLAEAEPTLRGYRTVGCSKVLRQLARLAGARPGRDATSPELHVDDLRTWIPRLAVMPAARRADLPGISRSRAHQALGGAVVAEALLTVLGGSLVVCPWSTTQGLLLTLLDRTEQRGPRRSVA